MKQPPKYTDEVTKLLAGLNGENNHQGEPQTNIPDTSNTGEIEDIYVFILRENPDLAEPTVIDSVATDLDTTPLPTKPPVQPTANAATGILPFGVFVILLCTMSIMLQFSMLFNPLTATITLVAKSQQVSLQGTLQLGRVLNPITVSQSSTVPTTGKGHQDAKQATGSLTFYNGQSNQVTVPAGTTLTGNSGEQIVTDTDATIPPANQTLPPTFGQTTVSAHAKDPGTRGNIATGDINQRCCATSILVQNTAPFSGGQDERNFQTVAKTDIANAAATLQATVTQGSNAALQGQLKTNEGLVTPSCTTTTTSDHQPGEEATQVKVTVSETCSAVAYNQDTLQVKVTQLLTTQAAKKLETGYSLLGNPQITVTSATTAKQVTLSFTSVSTWIYALSGAEQKHIKTIVAGKTKEKALQLLTRLPGIEHVSLQSSGFGDDSRIPKDQRNIHLLLIYEPV